MRNVYRLAVLNGEVASVTDPTWDKKTHRHTCCQSQACWRHKKACKNCLANAPEDLSDLKDL